jgi:uncharacterized Tic20 family protein
VVPDAASAQEANDRDMSTSIADPGLRVSDNERERVIDRLKDAYAEGRLEYDEFKSRLQLTLFARTRSDLAPITADLHPRPRRVVPTAVGGLDPKRPVKGEDRLLGAMAHGTAMVPIVVGPLMLMLTAGRKSPYVRQHAVEALNFQLTLLLVTIVTFGIGGIVYMVAWLVWLLGSLVALTGERFLYPFILRLVR